MLKLTRRDAAGHAGTNGTGEYVFRGLQVGKKKQSNVLNDCFPQVAVRTWNADENLPTFC